MRLSVMRINRANHGFAMLMNRKYRAFSKRRRQHRRPANNLAMFEFRAIGTAFVQTILSASGQVPLVVINAVGLGARHAGPNRPKGKQHRKYD